MSYSPGKPYSKDMENSDEVPAGILSWSITGRAALAKPSVGFDVVWSFVLSSESTIKFNVAEGVGREEANFGWVSTLPVSSLISTASSSSSAR